VYGYKYMGTGIVDLGKRGSSSTIRDGGISMRHRGKHAKIDDRVW